jgi:DNA-binding PadR family transcriptional regulator
MKPTPLAYALIGLTIQEARSGYALRKVFETTPIGIFSSSPGSIYPALRKLVEHGLLEQRESMPQSKPVFHPTEKGREWHYDWVSAPVILDEVASDIDIVMLRFAFHESIDDQSITLHFLTSFKTSVSEHLNNLKAFMKSPMGEELSTHGALAMKNGIKGYEAHLAWASEAIKEFEK